jgi:hypothetical protein
MEVSPKSLVLIDANAKSWTGLLDWAGVITAVLLVAGYVFIIGRSSYFWLLDFPNHLARATVMADLMFHHGSHFGADFQYQFMFVPYVLPDLALTGLIELLGPVPAASVWESLTFLSFPCAVLFFLRVNRTPTSGQIIGVLFATVLSPDWFFFGGALAFRLGLALTLVAVGLAIMLRRRRSIALACLYAVVVVSAYLTHVSALLFIIVAIGITGLLRLWYRETNLRTEALLWVPILALVAWKFGIVNQGRLTQNTLQGNGLFEWEWGTLHEKLSLSTTVFHRFGLPVETALNAGLLVCLGLAGSLAVRRRGSIRGWLLDPAVRDCLALSVTFLAMYFILPRVFPDAAFVDIRATAPAVTFLVAATLCGSATGDLNHRHLAVGAMLATTVLSIATLAVLREHLDSQDAWMGNYRRIVAAVPAGSRVWDITPELGPFAMPSSSILIDRNAIIPSLYSGDNGNPMLYFRYLHRPYVPQKRWLQFRGEANQPSPMVDWKRIGCDYDFILAEQPWDRRLLGVETSTIVENSSAMLLRLSSGSCEHSESGSSEAQ